MRWAVDAMVVVTLPVAAAMIAMSEPIMRVLAFGEAAEGDGPELLGAALLGLAIGIPVYGGFLLLTRAAYALGDSRTPAMAALGVGAARCRGDGRGRFGRRGPDRLVRRSAGATRWRSCWGRRGWRCASDATSGRPCTVRQLRPLALSVLLGVMAWVGMEAWDPGGRAATMLAVAVTAASAGPPTSAASGCSAPVPARRRRPARGADEPARARAGRLVAVGLVLVTTWPSAPSAPRRRPRAGCSCSPSRRWPGPTCTPARRPTSIDSSTSRPSPPCPCAAWSAGRTPATATPAISAGTRARGVPESGQVLEPDEDFFGVPAESVFRRNTGEVAGRTGW